MRDASDVPKLQEDAAATRVHGFRHILPAFDLLGRMNARGRLIALPVRADLCGL